jgi:Ca2+-binding RTX toxin-like protein
MRVLWLAILLFVLAPATARADGSIAQAGTELRYVSDVQDAEDLVISKEFAAFQCAPAATPCLQVANGDQGIRAGAGCVQVANLATIAACSPNVTSIRLTLNDGDDFVKVFDGVPPTTMDGGDGADNLDSRGGNDTVLGGPGDDTISDDGGTDVLDGGAGDDTIEADGGADDVRGGPGFDSVLLDNGDDVVHLDDLANDGNAGQGMNIHTDVEAVDGGLGSDNLFGNAGPNTLIGGAGNDILDGGPGSDVLDGGDGADEISGGPDVDRVQYTDAAAQTITLDDVRNDGALGELDNVHSDIEDVSAGPGNDTVTGSDAPNVLDGGAGNDTLDGRGGVDTFLGGSGADTLLARDGLQERVDCASDADGGQADTIDALTECENVLLSDALVPDVDGDGATKPSDCDDHNPAVHPGAVDVPENGLDEDCSGADAVNLDRDGDGFLRPSDCNDADARVHPGALEVPGNLVDEDCSGGAAPFPLLGSTLTVTYGFGTRFTVFRALVVHHARAGSTLTITCHGNGCPFRSHTRKLRRDQAKLTLVRPAGGARLRAGTERGITLTQPATVGLVTSYTVRAGKPPARTDLCLSPGAKRPARCPA